MIGNRILSKVQNSFWSCTHVNSCQNYILHINLHILLNILSKTTSYIHDRILSTTPGAEPPRDARDSGSARSHSTHLETSSSDRP